MVSNREIYEYYSERPDEDWDVLYYRDRMIIQAEAEEAIYRLNQELNTTGKQIYKKLGSSLRKALYLCKTKQIHYVRENNPRNNTRAFKTAFESKPFVLSGANNSRRNSKRYASSRVSGPGKKKSHIRG